MPKKPAYFSRGILSESGTPTEIEEYFDSIDHPTRYERDIEAWRVAVVGGNFDEHGNALDLNGDELRPYDRPHAGYWNEGTPKLLHMYIGTKNVYAIFSEEEDTAFVGIHTPSKKLLPYSVRNLLSRGVPMNVVYEKVSVDDAIDLKKSIVHDLRDMGWTVIQAIETGAIY